MALTIRQLTAPSHLMQTIAPQMQAYRNGYEGGPAFKNMTLIKRPSEDAALFRDKLLNVAVLPICKSVVDEIVDVVFEEEPVRHPAFISPVNNSDLGVPDWYEDFVNNADLNGNSFTAMMEQLATAAGIEGWAWVFVDLPAEVNRNNRPYISICSAEHVIDWKFWTEYGRDYLEYLKVIEYKDADCTIYRVWYAGDRKNPTICERYVIKEEHMVNQENLVEPVETFTLPMGMPIPAIQVLARADQRRSDLGVSDLQEAVDVQREMFKLECEAYDSIRFSKPMIRAAAGLRIPAGGGGIVRADKDQLEVFNIPTQDIAEIRAQQESLIVRLDGFLGRGSIRTYAGAQRVQSGIAIMEERRALHRKASQRARRMEASEGQILDLAAAFMDQRWVGDIEYNTDYEDKDLQFKMALLKTASDLSANNPVIQEIIDREVIKLITPPDETHAYLAKIGASIAQPQQNSTDWMSSPDAQQTLVREKESDDIFNSEIQDKGVTTNDPLARQLVMLGVGR
jgi:hypothetical protein